MRIEAPFLRISDYFWADYTRLWRNFTDKYNEGIESRDKLKAAHMNVFYRLIHFASKSIRKNNKELKDMPQLACMDNTKWLLIKGARKQLLARILHTSPDSIKRHLNRLEEAKVITTDPNDFMRLLGREKRWNELLINPDFMLIYDYANPEYVPTSPYLDETQKQGFQKVKSANCTGVSSISTLPDSSNNEIRDVHNFQKLKGVSPAVDELQKNYQNLPIPDATPNQADPNKTSKENSEKSALIGQKTDVQVHNKEKEMFRADKSPKYAPIRSKYSNAEQTLARIRRGLAIDLYIFMVQMLFFKHNIHENEKDGALEILENKYFSTVTDAEHGEFLMNRYKWRVNAAKGNIERTNFNFSNWYPQAYLKKSKGFPGTKAWLLKSEGEHMERKRKRLATYKSIEGGEILKRTVANYKAAPTAANFIRKTEELKEHNPHLVNEFIKRIQVLETA